jgi:hypothetical protein
MFVSSLGLTSTCSDTILLLAASWLASGWLLTTGWLAGWLAGWLVGCWLLAAGC